MKKAQKVRLSVLDHPAFGSVGGAARRAGGDPVGGRPAGEGRGVAGLVAARLVVVVAAGFAADEGIAVEDEVDEVVVVFGAAGVAAAGEEALAVAGRAVAEEEVGVGPVEAPIHPADAGVDGAAGFAGAVPVGAGVAVGFFVGVAFGSLVLMVLGFLLW